MNVTPAETRALGTYPAWRFPIEREIQILQKELNDLNERIAESEKVGHQGHAMEVLKAKAVEFARRIDELRCLLVETAAKDGLNSASRKRQLQRVEYATRIANNICCDKSPVLKKGTDECQRKKWLDAHGPKTICEN